MEDNDLKTLWKAYDHQLEASKILNLQAWAVQLRTIEMLQSHKAKSKLDRLSSFKLRAVILGIIWMLFLGVLLYGTGNRNPYFSISAGMILLLTAIVTVGYIRHIMMINSIRYDGNIADTQEKLAKLQTATLMSARVGWLQLPFYTTFFWHPDWVNPGSTVFWLIPLPITLLFAVAAVYLYRNVTPWNMHKKWVRTLVMTGPEYSSVLKARDFIEEIDAFRKIS